MSAMGRKRTLTCCRQSDRVLRQIQFDRRSRVLVGSLLIVSPILLSTIYLHLADLWPLWWNITDLLAGVGVIAVGIVGVCLLPIPGSLRAAASVAYAVSAAWLLFLSAISFRGGL